MDERILDSSLQRARGVIGRYPAEDQRYVLQYETVEDRGIHMVGVRKPLKVTWVADDEVVQEKVLEPWTGTGSARADRIIEQRPDSYRE